VPLFVSRRRLSRRTRLPQGRGPWALDSGGFSELSLYSAWTITVRQYVAEVRRYVDCIGKLRWATAMDWMCEPAILQRTKLTVEEHQRRTLENYRELLQLAPDLPWVPVFQGWSIGDYWRHADAYQKAGVDPSKVPVGGVGTLCRRQSTIRANPLLATLHAEGLRLHAFGDKLRGLALAKDFLQSADSLAWSYRARKHPPLPECQDRHAHCNTCLRFALRWRSKVLKLLGMEALSGQEPPVQRLLFEEME
jgi:hypothetical protein